MLATAAPARRLGLEGKLRTALLLLLGLFLFTLPLAEAPKNIAVGLYLAVWCVRAVATSDFGGRWDRFDTAFAAMLVSAMLSAYAGYVTDLSGVGRLLAMTWLVKRTGFSEREGRQLIVVACLGLVIGLALAVAPFMRTSRAFLELPSVGQVNQSALFIAVMAVAGFGWWRQGAAAWPEAWPRRVVNASAAIFGVGLLVSASRAAIVAALAGLVLQLVLVRPGQARLRIRRLLLATALLAALVAGLLWGLGKVAPNLAAGKLTPAELATTASFDQRLQHWRLAVEGWRQRPWLGFGPDSFQQLTVERACAWRVQRGKACDPEIFKETSHAHSLYIATLVERGLVGMLALAVLLGTWGWALARGASRAAASPFWVASAAAFVVVVVGGLLNTTLRVEHGSLALMWLALWASMERS